MTPLDTLYSQVTQAIAHPHTTITEHDKERAAKVFTLIYNYLAKDHPSSLFAEYAQEVLDSLK